MPAISPLLATRRGLSSWPVRPGKRRFVSISGELPSYRARPMASQPKNCEQFRRSTGLLKLREVGRSSMTIPTHPRYWNESSLKSYQGYEISLSMRG